MSAPATSENRPNSQGVAATASRVGCVVKHQHLSPNVGLYCGATQAAPEGDVMSERRWYVVKTLPRRELFAAEQLLNQDYRVFLPKQVKTIRHARRVRTGFSAFFPSYLFVQLDVARERWRSINGTRGVSHIVTQGERPVPVPAGVIEDLIAASDERGVLVEGPWLEVGQHVKITHGPFVDQVAVIERFGNADGVRVLLEIMGAIISVEAKREHLIAAA